MLKEIKTLEKMIKELQKINEKIKKNPMLFYGETGKRFIQLSKEQHLLGHGLIRAGYRPILKNLPIES